MTVDLSPDARLVVAVDSDWLEQFERDHPDRLRRRLSRHLPARVRRRDSAWRLSASNACGPISNSAKAIIGGDIRQRMPVGPRRDEFDEVAITLNRMLDRIEGLLENLRQVSSDVAHDLRTPLSRLRTRLEQGVLRDSPPARPTPCSKTRFDRIDEVLSLFGAILRIAEVESGETKRYFERVDLSALVDASSRRALRCRSRTAGGACCGRSSPVSLSRRPRVARASVHQLLENAQRHTPVGTVIRLTGVAAGDTRLCAGGR